jgi:hypothetical protein
MCPNCGADLCAGDAGGRHLLTPFGHGMCGLIAGGLMGAAATVCCQLRAPDLRLLLFPAAGGATFAAAASFVGRRLALEVRPGYEALLLALVAAGVSVLAVALAGVSSPEALGALGALVTLVGAPMLARAMHRAPMKTSPQAGGPNHRQGGRLQ